MTEKKLKPPSEEFLQAVQHAGSLVISCEFCDRTYFATWCENDYDDEEELEELREQAKKEPDKYIEWGDVSSISWGTVDGKQYVLDCPCNGARKYEDWILRHRWIIAEYFKSRATKLKEEAEREVNLSEGLVGMSESIDEFSKILKEAKASKIDFPTKQGQRKVKIK